MAILRPLALRAIGAAALASGLGLSAGCHTAYEKIQTATDGWTGAEVTHKPIGPSVAGAHTTAVWDKRVYFAPDPSRGGTPIPGLVGRIYLLDMEVTGTGLAGEGELVIDFWDHTPMRQGQQPKRLPGCNYKAEHLRMFMKKDPLWGWGYTVFLPWPEYSPDVKEVYLEAKFIPANGEPPMHAAGSRFAIDHSAAIDDGTWKLIRHETGPVGPLPTPPDLSPPIPLPAPTPATPLPGLSLPLSPPTPMAGEPTAKLPPPVLNPGPRMSATPSWPPSAPAWR